MKQTPWKNGGGVTSEIAIHPQAAQLAKLDFDWRVSLATVASDGPFSRFPGYDRLLVVWKGAGLKLNGEDRKRLEPFRFAGEDEINASLISGDVKDFGVIFKRDAVRAALDAHALRENEAFVLTSFASTSFILCAEGELRIGEFYLNPGEIVRADFEARTQADPENKSEQLSITALAHSKFVVVNLCINS
jgi:uncharacterized protein